MSNPITTMLVADDSRFTRSIFRASAERAKVSLIEACDGLECARHLNGGHVDLAFIDVHMPHMSGLEAVWGARDHGSKAFVTLMSGSANVEIIEHARKLRAYEFLFKPFTSDEVDRIIGIHQRLSTPTRALVVDDSRTVRKVVQKVLAESLFRIELTEAPDGETAFALCQSEHFDIIFLDCNMPGLDGLETLDWLLAHDRHTKVVMISGTWNKEREREALIRGAIGFLRKPFVAADIDALLHELYGLSPSNLTGEASGLITHFDTAIIGRTISTTHNVSRSVYEYLWFRNSPYLRCGQVRENNGTGQISRQVRADAEMAAVMAFEKR
jgi:CheY-like chemotaxis protein